MKRILRNLGTCGNNCRLDGIYIRRYALAGLAMEPAQRAVSRCMRDAIHEIKGRYCAPSVLVLSN